MSNRLNKVTVVQTAADMADRNGLSSVTLKTLSEELGIKSPSIYKHIPNGLDGLHRELMLYGWRSVEAVMVKAAVGKSKDDAMYAISCAFRDFVKAHTGLFEAMQWYNMYVSDETLQATEKIVDLLFQVLDGYKLSEKNKVNTVRTFRAFWQGYSSIECHNGYGNSQSIDESFDFAIKILLKGISELQEEQL